MNNKNASDIMKKVIDEVGAYLSKDEMDFEDMRIVAMKYNVALTEMFEYVIALEDKMKE